MIRWIINEQTDKRKSQHKEMRREKLREQSDIKEKGK